jgi:prepilin-type N-terminal cleavage/methylation domain-containing protein/prepilin-type processing-associated H-X9-DG protein
MESRQRRKRQEGFTLIEVIVCIAIVALLAALVILPGMQRSKARAQRISCVGRLKCVALSFRAWAIDYTNAFPMAVSTNLGGSLEHAVTGEIWRHFQVMSNELNTPVVVHCPSDGKRTPLRSFGGSFSNTNISYFVGLDANDTTPQMFLAGDLNLVGGTPLSSRMLLLTTNTAVRWGKDLHKHRGNIALADGSVQGISSLQLEEALANKGAETNCLALP